MWVSFTGHPFGKDGSSISFRTSPMAESSDYRRDVGHIKSLNTNCTLSSLSAPFHQVFRENPSCGFSGIQDRRILPRNQALPRSGEVGCTLLFVLPGRGLRPCSALLPLHLPCLQLNSLHPLRPFN